jgi:hypothetical protein
MGPEQLGGIREYWFCSECNNRTGEWDKCYAAWSRELEGGLVAEGQESASGCPPGSWALRAVSSHAVSLPLLGR